jgi:vancomycin resistance protein YoaR
LAEFLLSAEDKVLEIPVILTYPKIKTGDVNNLGIKELIGTGKSTFFHSIPGRVFNVNLAASRISGTLVGPGEEFSFVKAVGDISKTTGYQTAYIISEGRTVLGDGGGVCQVSTTTFRAALDAGLPITERKAHAYRVGYYEQDSPPGIDATVYYPTADLKFLNDTGNYILIQETVDTKNLSMKVEIYGTSDGRKSSLSKPRISNQSPPPPTMYVDDPTLPLGTMKQIDWSAWGAKVVFDYKVERNGENIYEKTFVSNYQPWQAVYLKGTGN